MRVCSISCQYMCRSIELIDKNSGKKPLRPKSMRSKESENTIRKFCLPCPFTFSNVNRESKKTRNRDIFK